MKDKPTTSHLDRIIYLRQVMRNNIQESLMLENRKRESKEYLECLMEENNQENFEYFLGLIEDLLIQGKKLEEL